MLATANTGGASKPSGPVIYTLSKLTQNMITILQGLRVAQAAVTERWP